MSTNSLIGRTMLLALALAAFALAPASARSWKPSPKAAALNYSQIIDTQEHQVVLLWWMAAPAFDSDDVKPMLTKYFILGYATADFSESMEISFREVHAPQVFDSEGKPLNLLTEGNQPTLIVASVAALKDVLVKMVGPLGKGMQIFVYEAGSVDACKPGKISIPVGAETYTYDTPIPGCPGK